MIQRLAIIGVGLIGGSLARALRNNNYVKEIIGCGRGKENLEKAVELGVIDSYTHEPAEAVAGADMIVIATNLRAIPAIFETIAPKLSDSALITDVGSAKTEVIKAAQQHLGDAFARFIPGHPIAGTEKNGVEASFAELFIDHKVILTPTAKNSLADIQRIRDMWQTTGGVSHPDDRSNPR